MHAGRVSGIGRSRNLAVIGLDDGCVVVRSVGGWLPRVGEQVVGSLRGVGMIDLQVGGDAIAFVEVLATGLDCVEAARRIA